MDYFQEHSDKSKRVDIPLINTIKKEPLLDPVANDSKEIMDQNLREIKKNISLLKSELNRVSEHKPNPNWQNAWYFYNLGL